ncbi:hypothetical protein ACNO8X_08270 [Mycobacterium sp. PDNC021]|uniref:hypothetical protein n=1 Tax=Mycobacterium sp. PDNC021 TaxID=3391399 RepID=UPI003AADF484
MAESAPEAVPVAGTLTASGSAAAALSGVWCWPLTVLAAGAGLAIVGYSYRLSGTGGPPSAYYLVFWGGMLLAALPAAAKLIGRAGGRTDRLWAVAMLGLVTMAPKLIRNPFGPRYHDEYAHWRQAVDLVDSGHLFQPNTLIPIVQFYPGTSGLTGAIQSITGLSTWTSGLVVIAVMHVTGLFGVYVLGERLLGSSRAGGIAALVYGINPSAVYFDTQYAYESVAINWFLWVVALTAIAAHTPDMRRRFQCLSAAGVLAMSVVVTHHLTTAFLLGVTATVAVTGTVALLLPAQRRRPIGRPTVGTAVAWWITFTVTLGSAAAWVWFCARPTLDYLSPYFGSAVTQLRAMAGKSGAGGRKLLAAQVQPYWEQLLTATAPVVLLVTVGLAALLVKRGRVRLSATTWGLVAFGLCYFLSLPFILAPSGAEGARRSWGFTYVGIAVIVAIALDRWPATGMRFGRKTMTVWTAVLTVVLLIGNVGGGLNDPYRFPGPFRWGTDTNSATDETRSVARQLNQEFGRVQVVSDAYTGLQLAADGGMYMAFPAPGFPAWELVQSDADPSKSLAGMLVYSGYKFLVVDVMMGRQLPFNGHNFGPEDPLRGDKTPMANLLRLDAAPWATRILATENLRVYRLHLDDLARSTAKQ